LCFIFLTELTSTSASGASRATELKPSIFGRIWNIFSSIYFTLQYLLFIYFLNLFYLFLHLFIFFNLLFKPYFYIFLFIFLLYIHLFFHFFVFHLFLDLTRNLFGFKVKIKEFLFVFIFFKELIIFVLKRHLNILTLWSLKVKSENLKLFYVLYCTVLYCTVLYCTVLYCTCVVVRSNWSRQNLSIFLTRIGTSDSSTFNHTFDQSDQIKSMIWFIF